MALKYASVNIIIVSQPLLFIIKCIVYSKYLVNDHLFCKKFRYLNHTLLFQIFLRLAKQWSQFICFAVSAIQRECFNLHNKWGNKHAVQITHIQFFWKFQSNVSTLLWKNGTLILIVAAVYSNHKKISFVKCTIRNSFW